MCADTAGRMGLNQLSPHYGGRSKSTKLYEALADVCLLVMWLLLCTWQRNEFYLTNEGTQYKLHTNTQKCPLKCFIYREGRAGGFCYSIPVLTHTVCIDASTRLFSVQPLLHNLEAPSPTQAIHLST